MVNENSVVAQFSGVEYMKPEKWTGSNCLEN